jgi:hypothetical protein
MERTTRMRGITFFGGSRRRNDPVRLEDPHPIPNYGTHSLESGNAGLDGFTTLSRADPNAQGNPPPVKGTVGPTYRGPDNSFEQ